MAARSCSTGRPGNPFTALEPDVRTHTLTQTADVEIVVRVDDNGAHIEHRHRTIESFATPLFLAAVARLSTAVEPFAWYGAFRLDQPYNDSAASTHCITVFRKLSTFTARSTLRQSA